jgi:DNA topoisomerase-2
MSKATDYEKMTPIEHILKRPDTYIGSTRITTNCMDVYDSEDKIIKSKIIKYTPGFLKIFDEVLVNARDASENDKTCNIINIWYNKEQGYIRIYNNGDRGIPVEMHPIHKVLAPSLIFGELLTSSNYDDTKKKTTGGKNGLGSKLSSAYSKSFTVEIGDAERKKHFIQEWTNNMQNTDGPKVTKYSKKTSYVDITFYPDVKRFGLEALDDDHMMLFYRRAIDIAGTSSDKVKVTFNDEKINVANFKQYIQYYYPKDEIYFDESDDGRWKVGVLYIQESNNKVISFANSIATYKGGSHVNHVADKIIKQLVDNHIKKKNKDVKISPSILKENLVFFVNAVIENPSFDSQTKETLTTEPKEFGSKYEPTESFIKKLAKCGIVEQVLDYAKFKESKDLKKNDGKKQKTIHGIPKLDDANEAGGKNSNKCALILTEGDSAKATAVAGLSVIGRDYFGVFPLKGKMLNVREASVKQLTENEEISNLKKIMGLRQGCKYDNDEDFASLRYGRIIILTDADADGSHIKGLVMNMFHSIWPELVQRKGFITSLATPIVKAFKNKDNKTFYTITEYDDWIKSLSESAKKSWKIKYYKGLGTSTAAEAKEYFIDVNDKLIKYKWEKDEEENNALTLAFQKSRADDRKEWLMNYDRNEILTYE